MRLKSLLFTLLMLACFSTAKAAHVYVGVEYGSTGDETRGYELPSFARYSVSRQIYTASEIGRSGFIKSISFCLRNMNYWNGARYVEAGTLQRKIDLYLKHTSATEFYCSDEEYNFRAGDMVYSGWCVYHEYQWITIEFDVPFFYNGVDNLMIGLDDNTGGNDFYLYSLVFPTTKSQAHTVSASSSINYVPFDIDINAPIPGDYNSRTYNFKLQLDIEMYDIDQLNDGQSFVATDKDPVYQDFLPTTSFYKYSITQQIYTADEISHTGEAKLIRSISLYNTGREKTRKISLWFFPTYKSSFDTFGDWVEIPRGEPLFEGEVTFYEDNWTVIPLSMPVLSNGQNNFVLCVNDETGAFGYGGGPSFLSFETTENQQMNMYGDTQPFNPDDIKSYNGYYGDKVKNKLLFNNASDLSLIPRPTDINVEAQPTSAVVTWNNTEEGVTYQLCYKPDTETNWYGPYDLDEQRCRVTGLTPNTKYRVRVRANHNGDTSHWTSAEFTTPDCTPADIAVTTTSNTATISWTGYSDSYDVLYRELSTEPIFFDDFEHGLEYKEWQIGTNGQARNEDQGWFTENVTLRSSEGATYTNHSGSYCAVSESWEGSVGGMAADNWLITPEVELGGTLKFWQWVSGAYPDSYEVWVLVLETGSLFPLRSLAPGKAGWNEVVIDLSAYQGQRGVITIRHRDTDKMWLFIDDFAIYSAEPWQKVTTTEQEVTLTDLKPNTKYEYKIVAHQPGTAAASTDILNFKTPEWQPVLTDIAVVPDATSAAVSWTGNCESYEVEYREAATGDVTFFDDFENGLEDKGWKVYTQGETSGGEGWFTQNMVDRSAGEKNHSGSTSVFAESWTNVTNGLAADNWLVTPQVELGGTLKFWQWVRGGYPDSYEVLLSTTGNAIEDFTTTLRLLGPGEDNWFEVVIDLSAYEGQQGYIAIHHKCTDMFWMGIDDFGIYPLEQEWMSVTTTEQEVTLTDLQPETTYELRITGFSDGEAEIVSDIVNFTTIAPHPIDLVLDCNGDNFETIQANDGAWANVTINNLTLKKDGKWQAVCLPFDVDVENSPLAGADVRTLESVTVTNAVCTLDCPTPQTTMEANKPYILRWNEGEDIVNPVFEDVTIKFVRMDDSGQWLKIEDAGYFGAHYDYIGIMPDMLYLGNQSPILTKTDTSIELHAFEGFFFIYTSIQSVASVFVLNTGYEDDLITGIAGVNANADSDAIYNLAGQRLSKTQKGVNIVGSKKILVK